MCASWDNKTKPALLATVHVEGRVIEVHPQTEDLDINPYSQFWH